MDQRLEDQSVGSTFVPQNSGCSTDMAIAYRRRAQNVSLEPGASQAFRCCVDSKMDFGCRWLKCAVEDG